MKYAMVVTLYHPTAAMLEHLQIYRHSFEKIFVFDNTPYEPGDRKPTDSFQYPVFTYYSFSQNLGICVALNVCCFAALRQGFDYAFLFDQDSDFTPDDITLMKKDVETYSGPKAAMFGPTICYDPDRRANPITTHEGWHIEKWIITSGTVLSLPAFQTIGPFDPKFFIAYIEPWYCLEAKRKGFATIVFENVVLYQMQGYFMIYHGKKHRADPPIRDYYVHRNRLYFAHKSFHWFQRGVFYLKSLHDYLRILLHEPEKKKRFAYLAKARRDFHKKEMGRIKE
jgi:rhamnosyltransferase